MVDRFSAEVDAHLTGAAPPVDPLLVVALRDIEGDAAVLDERHRDKQPDWSYDEVDSGKTPAERHGEHRAPEPPEN